MKKGHHKSEYQKFALQAAKELCYGPEVQKKIEEAKDDHEIERIMNDARKSCE